MSISMSMSMSKLTPMSSVPSNSTADRWDAHKSILEDLYLVKKKTLAQVMGIMEEDYDFHEKKNQYEKHFKKWSWSKNLRSKVWKSMLPMIREHDCQGKEVEVFVEGVRLEPEKIHREMKRYRRQSRPNISSESSQLPPSVTIRPRPTNRSTHFLLDVPFYVFEGYLNDILPCASGTVTHYDVTDSNSYEAIGSSPSKASVSLLLFDFATLRSLPELKFEFLQAAVPPEMIRSFNPATSIINPATRLYTSPLHRLILFSLANNFAGLGTLSMENVVEHLQKETSQTLYEMVCSASGYYTARAIAQNLFRAAIEIGDATVVKLLLKHHSINVNSFICSVSGKRCTPLDRASGLQHKDIVRALLGHGADPNLSPMAHTEVYYGTYKSCFEHLMDYWGQHQPTNRYHPRRLNSEIFGMLLDAGGDPSRLSDKYLQRLIKDYTGNESVVLQVISKLASSKHSDWIKHGILHHIIMCLNHETSLKIVKILQDVGADMIHLNLHMGLVDIAAEKGHLDMMIFLHSSNVCLTDSTLKIAIESGNEDLVWYLLKHGASTKSVSILDGYSKTPLAAAILLGYDGENILKMIVEHGALKHLCDPSHFTAAFIAASEVENTQFLKLLHDFFLGHQHDPTFFSSLFKIALDLQDVPFIEFLLQLDSESGLKDLRYELQLAIKNGNNQSAQTLIDAGVDIGRHYVLFAESPLSMALKTRNAFLVRLLLNADRSPNYIEGNGRSMVMLAVEWGDRGIIQDLVNAGADLNSADLIRANSSSRYDATASLNFECLPLVYAIQIQDIALAKFLLENGAKINNSLPKKRMATALYAAAKTRNTGMTRFLLEHGAEPYDNDALYEAVEHSPDMVNLLLDWHKSRYPQGNKDFGIKALKRTIDSGNTAMFQRMLDKGIDVTSLDEILVPAGRYGQKTSPFGYAIAKAKDDDLRFLEMTLNGNPKWDPEVVVSRTGSNFSNSEPVSRMTAFLAAIGTGNTSSVKLFIKHGAKINFPPRMGVKRTPLQRAAECGNIEIVRLLIDSGADVNGPAAERGGGTAVQLAAMGGYLGIIHLLLDYDANVDAPASKVNGITALEGAAKYGRTDTVAFLLKAGAGNGGKDRAQFEKAISAARDEGHEYICDMLNHFLEKGEVGTGLEKFDDLIAWPGDEENAY